VTWFICSPVISRAVVKLRMLQETDDVIVKCRGRVTAVRVNRII